MDENTLKKMEKAARAAMAHAHAPVSRFPVGAAVITPEGTIYPGCNTESIIPSLGTCAERSAIDHAVVHGDRAFAAVLIVSTRPEPLFPCGACRQYIFEFAQKAGLDTMVYALGSGNFLENAPISQLLPKGWGPLDKEKAVFSPSD